MKRQGIMWTAAAVLAAVATIAYAQDKYVLKSPGGIAFADFRGYEDWAVISSARTDSLVITVRASGHSRAEYGMPLSWNPTHSR